MDITFFYRELRESTPSNLKVVSSSLKASPASSASIARL
jgi:hypothetical protein